MGENGTEKELRLNNSHVAIMSCLCFCYAIRSPAVGTWKYPPSLAISVRRAGGRHIPIPTRIPRQGCGGDLIPPPRRIGSGRFEELRQFSHEAIEVGIGIDDAVIVSEFVDLRKV